MNSGLIEMWVRASERVGAIFWCYGTNEQTGEKHDHNHDCEDPSISNRGTSK